MRKAEADLAETPRTWPGVEGSRPELQDNRGKTHPQAPEATRGKGGYGPGPLGVAAPCQDLDLGSLASRTERE